MIALLHSIQAETGPRSLDFYCENVIACITDQGRVLVPILISCPVLLLLLLLQKQTNYVIYCSSPGWLAVGLSSGSLFSLVLHFKLKRVFSLLGTEHLVADVTRIDTSAVRTETANELDSTLNKPTGANNPSKKASLQDDSFCFALQDVSKQPAVADSLHSIGHSHQQVPESVQQSRDQDQAIFVLSDSDSEGES